jgi:hypothetical protein
MFAHIILQEDANNRGEAKAWLISTLAGQQQQQTSAALRMACFDPCGLQGSRDSLFEAADTDSRRAAVGGRRYSENTRSVLLNSSRQPPKQQQQAPSPVSSCKPAALQLLRLLCDAQPAAVAQLLCKDPRFLCSCLTASPATTAAWFGQFSLSGIQHFKHGARALANYALTHRNEVWQHLVWAGKHDQVRLWEWGGNSAFVDALMLLCVLRIVAASLVAMRCGSTLCGHTSMTG